MTRPERFWSKQAPDDRAWDAIVIGSGMGGMTTAALLARSGKRVLVLEQHYVPGGYTHTFRRKGFVWDVGVHLVGEMSDKAMPGRILQGITGGRLAWAPTGSPYDTFYFPDDDPYGFPDHPGAFAELLASRFPDDADDIDAYMRATKEVTGTMRSFYAARMMPGRLGRRVGGWMAREATARLDRTVDEVLPGVVRNPQLRTVMNAQWGYHGAPPSQASWAIQALVARHFMRGAWYPVGGSASIAREMLRVVAEHGGWTRIVASVDRVLIENGRAVGVRMADGEEIRAPRVISAIGAHHTVHRLLPEPDRQAPWARSVAEVEPAPAHVCLYLGFQGDIAAAGATRSAQWYYQTWDHEQSTWDVHPDRPVPPPPCLFTSFASLKDPEHDPGPEQRHTGEIVTFVPWQVFERWRDTAWRRRGEDYEAFKAEMSERMLDILFQHHPGLKPLLVHHELSTPLSSDLFVRPYHGSIYGLAHTPARFRNGHLRPSTPISGLTLSGSDVSCGGVVGAMMGGVLGALAVDPVRVGRDLFRLASP